MLNKSFLIEPVCDWSCPSVDSWPIFKCSPILFRNKTTEICVSHCREIVWKSHPHYSHMGPFWAKKGSSRICIQYWAPKTLVSCPTRWFLLLTFGFLWWSSSWWWQPYIAGCKLLRPQKRNFSARGQMSELRSKCQIEEQRGNCIQIIAMINGR